MTSPPLRTSCISPAVLVMVPFFSYAAAGGQDDVGTLRGFREEQILHDQQVELAQAICRGEAGRLYRVRADHIERVQLSFGRGSQHPSCVHPGLFRQFRAPQCGKFISRTRVSDEM